MGCTNSKVTSDASKRQVENSSRSSHKNSLLLDVNSDPNASIKTLTFRHVMQDPLGRTYFMMFLKKEHAEENLIFFEVILLLDLLSPAPLLTYLLYRPLKPSKKLKRTI